MKIKIQDLIGAALDWAVNQIEECSDDPNAPPFSTNWTQGGPIIEREQITLRFSENTWVAEWWADNSGMTKKPAQRFRPNRFEVGPTPLVAAMRCYVASQLGDEVEIPNELVEV